MFCNWRPKRMRSASAHSALPLILSPHAAHRLHCTGRRAQQLVRIWEICKKRRCSSSRVNRIRWFWWRLCWCRSDTTIVPDACLTSRWQHWHWHKIFNGLTLVSDSSWSVSWTVVVCYSYHYYNRLRQTSRRTENKRAIYLWTQTTHVIQVANKQLATTKRLTSWSRVIWKRGLGRKVRT